MSKEYAAEADSRKQKQVKQIKMALSELLS
jgi:hypothetical protein